MQVFLNKSLRKILKIRWTGKISNESVWTQTKQRPIEEEIRKRRWRWMGHSLRKPGNSITGYHKRFGLAPERGQEEDREEPGREFW